jgi:hypothetical protein
MFEDMDTAGHAFTPGNDNESIEADVAAVGDDTEAHALTLNDDETVEDDNEAVVVDEDEDHGVA